MKSNLLFYLMIFFSVFMFFSSNSWINMWLWLEVNLIMFISLMINNNNKMSIESSLIYFLIQSISSIILLFSILMLMFKNNFLIILLFSILIKLGSSPFHYWVPLIIEGLNWKKIYFLLTWQKINPLYMLFMNNYYYYLKIFIFMSLIIGSISGLNYISLKKIISFSSINQLSWLMMSMISNKMIKIYMIMYMLLMWMITKSFYLFNLNFLNQLFNMKMKNKFFKLFIFMNMLSLGGLPPFIGFFPKMFLIMNINKSFMMFIMIMFSLLTLFMYLRIIFSMLILNSMKMNKFFKNYSTKKIKFMMKLSIFNNFFLMIFMFLI